MAHRSDESGDDSSFFDWDALEDNPLEQTQKEQGQGTIYACYTVGETDDIDFFEHDWWPDRADESAAPADADAADDWCKSGEANKSTPQAAGAALAEAHAADSAEALAEAHPKAPLRHAEDKGASLQEARRPRCARLPH